MLFAPTLKKQAEEMPEKREASTARTQLLRNDIQIYKQDWGSHEQWD